jgi:hypothetical protein
MRGLRSNVLAVGLLAALCTAIFRGLDNFTVHNLITAPDKLTAAFAYLIIGGWTGVIAGTFFSLLLGRKLIDDKFRKIVFNNRQMHWSAFISGSISAGSTLFILLGNQLGDPSVIVALSTLTIVYTILYDLFTGQADWKYLFLPSLVTITGGMMAGFSGSLSVTAIGLFYVVVVSNGLGAFSEIIEQRGIRASDSVNLFIWRFFWLALTGTILAIAVSLARGYLSLLIATIQQGMIYLPWVITTMFFVFVAMGLKFYLKVTQAVSVVLLILSAQIILAYPITIIGDRLQPGLFGELPNLSIWMVRIVGAILIIVGIVQLEISKHTLQEITETNILKKAMSIVASARKNILVTMDLSQELNQPLPPEYFRLLEQKLNQKVALKRVAFGTQDEFDEFMRKHSVGSPDYHCVLAKTPDYFRMLMVDESQLLFSLRTPKGRKFFFTQNKNDIKEYLEYFKKPYQLAIEEGNNYD